MFHILTINVFDCKYLVIYVIQTWKILASRINFSAGYSVL